jgi:hypothetical protein
LCCNPRRAPVDLRGVGGAAQLARQLVALREAGGAERVALGQQSAGRIGDEPAAIGVVAIVDEAFRAAFGTEAEGLIGDQLIVRETVVQFDDVDILRSDAGGLIDLVGRALRHVEADHLHHVAGVEGRGCVLSSSPARRSDFLAQAVLAGELLRDQHGRRAPQVGGQAISRVMTPGQITWSFMTSSA